MNKEYLEESIKKVEESIKISKENEISATNHTEEGELILEALKKKLKLIGSPNN